MSKSTHSAKAVVQFDLVWFIVKRSSLRIFFIFLFFHPLPIIPNPPINNIWKKFQPPIIPTPQLFITQE